MHLKHGHKFLLMENKKGKLVTKIYIFETLRKNIFQKLMKGNCLLLCLYILNFHILDIANLERSLKKKYYEK